MQQIFLHWKCNASDCIRFEQQLIKVNEVKMITRSESINTHMLYTLLAMTFPRNRKHNQVDVQEETKMQINKADKNI